MERVFLMPSHTSPFACWPEMPWVPARGHSRARSDVPPHQERCEDDELFIDERWHRERLARCRVRHRSRPSHLARLGIEGQQIAITCAAGNLALLEDNPRAAETGSPVPSAPSRAA